MENSGKQMDKIVFSNAVMSKIAKEKERRALRREILNIAGVSLGFAVIVSAILYGLSIYMGGLPFEKPLLAFKSFFASLDFRSDISVNIEKDSLPFWILLGVNALVLLLLEQFLIKYLKRRRII